MEGLYWFICFWDFDSDFNYPENCQGIVLSLNSKNEINKIVSLRIVPNPCVNKLVLSFTGMNIENQWAELIDINGRNIKHIPIKKVNQTIDTKLLTNGIYILSVYNNNGLIGREKIIVTR